MSIDRSRRHGESPPEPGRVRADGASASRSGRPGIVEPETEAAAIIAEEELLHGRVQTRVAMGEEDDGVRVVASDYDRELIRLRDMIAEAKPEDMAPLVEQMTRLAAIRSRLGGSRTLPVDVKSPYFAHMVLREGQKSRDVLLGKRGFIDRKHNVQIVDWRNAPISRIYYRYEEGDDYEEEIAGRSVAGLVAVRRNVSIYGGKLRRIGAPQGTFIRDARNVWHQAVGQAVPVLRGGQGKAVRVPRVTRGGKRERRLGVHHGRFHRADKALPEIAALIDREQFDLITQPDSGMVVIQGGAGSGKTTVALHRIAYLNFADRQRFRPSSILFVVPSRALVKYVAGVLPALGVNGVPVVTYQSWARNQRLKLLRGSSGKYTSFTPDSVSLVKKHPAILSIVEDYVAEQADKFTSELDSVLDRARSESHRDRVREAWHSAAHKPLVPRLNQLARWARGDHSLPSSVRIAVDNAVKRLRRRAADVVADWAEIMTDAGRLLAGMAGSEAVKELDIQRTVRWCTRQAAAAEEVPTDLDGNPLSTVDSQIASEQGYGQSGTKFGDTLADEDDPTGCYDPEDDPILLRLIQLKRGRLVSADGHEIAYEHVAIDEAQDRSAIEVKVLIDATRAAGGDPSKRSITIAGDTAQRLVFDNSFTGWQALLENMGHAAVIKPLRLSYRSTAEVMDFAREILGPELAPEEPLVARSGEPVELHQFGGIGEAVAFLADALRGLAAREPTASVALLARYSEIADAYYSGLTHAEVPALRRVRLHDFSFTPGIDVTDMAQVKGLEFDYVIMLDVTASSYPATVESRHLLHIGATRAAHQLWLISAGEPSPLLPEAMHDGGFAGANAAARPE